MNRCQPLRRFLAAILGGITVLVSGCATPQATLTANYSPEKHYRKIYMVRMDNDPREVQPKVVARLQGMGFEVELMDPDKPGRESQGSGFVISDQGHVLTCAHVVGDEKTATIWLAGERMYADVVQADTNTDIALLKLETPVTNQVLRLVIDSTAPPTMGQEVYTIGFPLSEILGTSPRLAKGLVSSNVGMHDDPKQIQVSVEVQAGNSGSPLLNENGDVVGMINSTLSPMNVMAVTHGTLPQNVNFAIKPDALSDFVKQAGISGDRGNAEKTKLSFDRVKDSVVLVRSGRILPGEELSDELWCRINYHYFWDMYWRFQIFYLEFFDAKTGKLILKAGQYGDSLGTEDATIKRTFKRIREKFNPNPS
ncbi:MAG TPA: serine protease [Verrucomicrobiae bacterium]|nr:serine protease [Verrucomicrobiae bacterium]